MDLPLYTTVSRTELSDVGSANYHLFDRAVVLDQVMRQAGQDADQQKFRDILLRMRNAECTLEDWKHLMRHTQAEDSNAAQFSGALHLYPTAAEVGEHNAIKLCANGQPVATIKAVHIDPGGLDPVVCLAQGARVMLCSNRWVEVGLVNGAIGTVVAVCYENDHCPPELPVAVTVKLYAVRGLETQKIALACRFL